MNLYYCVKTLRRYNAHHCRSLSDTSAVHCKEPKIYVILHFDAYSSDSNGKKQNSRGGTVMLAIHTASIHYKKKK
jgi:hypothetical protein